jgi:cGMP-dependent protein kinase
MVANDYVELYAIDSESFRELLKRNNEIVLKEKYNFLNNISIFESLDKISKYNVAQKLKKREFNPNTKIIKKGEIGEKLYIIKEGIVSCKIGMKEIRKLSNNEYFGQNAILREVKRGADIITLQKCVCYEISKNDLKEALSEDYIDVILLCFFNYCINNNQYMKQIIIESLINNIFRCFTIKQYHKKEHIYSQKSADESKRNRKRLIIIVSGSIYENGNLLAEQGKILGEEIFQDYNNKNISDEMIAYPDCITLEASIDDLAKVMNIDLNKEKPYNILRYINKLKKSYLFKNLSENTLESIAKNMKKEKFNKGDYIIKEGTYGNTFYLISKGKVTITKDGKPLRVLEQGECLGEKSLLSNDSLRTASAVAEEKVICYVIYKKEFDMILSDSNTREYLLKKLAFQNTDIQLSDLFYIKFLGKGKFGSVSLVHNKHNFYAIKAISIKMVEREKMLWKYFVNERSIMLSLDHPFIVKMVKSLRNKHFCFILMEFVNELNLDDHLSKKRTRNNIYETQFYIGSILLMLDYLQKKQIAHRDIKPSNIMIDTNGYLKMIDFGTAKVLTDYTSTIIGTPHYIAPEILQGKGYSLSCDFWSLGICMFEIFYGIYPFGNNANEVIDIYKEVLKKNLVFPSENSKYVNVNSFIKELLTKKVNERLCNVSKLKHKTFFEGFDFNKLNDFQLNPPYKPNKNDLTKFFKETTPYESILKEEKESTLQHKKKKKIDEDDENDDYNPNWFEEF